MALPKFTRITSKINSLLKDTAELMKVRNWHFNIRKTCILQEIGIYLIQDGIISKKSIVYRCLQYGIKQKSVTFVVL